MSKETENVLQPERDLVNVAVHDAFDAVRLTGGKERSAPHEIGAAVGAPERRVRAVRYGDVNVRMFEPERLRWRTNLALFLREKAQRLRAIAQRWEDRAEDLEATSRQQDLWEWAQKSGQRAFALRRGSRC